MYAYDYNAVYESDVTDLTPVIFTGPLIVDGVSNAYLLGPSSWN